MRNKYGLIITILIILLLAAEAALFLAKDQVVSFFENQANLADLSKPVKIVPAKVVDDSAIKSDLFKALKNNVNNFNFNDICKRPLNATVPVVVATTTGALQNPEGTAATTTPPANISCQQGNNNPFMLKKKVE